ncbi:type VII secretion protein EccB [Corynebacterium breve]|uniref:Type VII secretion protein EccB n=1 Tax=Corynebacterium breve TaxID=3049799 RepID=A0ABY8VEQ3_9CORY|nr:type VII secretion protein EccB [Corynebacterium breve]WIM68130.1 type VII secretion protein EccB [Corynebacterium breve]
MAGKLLPTTRAQVSGHKFLRRRVEHGLIFGDIRMIHDPLASRRRAAVLGLVATVLIAAVAGLLAWLNPNADPGDAPVVRSSQGALFVRVDGTLHPVTNLASARLVAGAPEIPARIGDETLANTARGVPVGIDTAPQFFAGEYSASAAWAVCQVDEKITVFAGPKVAVLGDDHGIVARVDDAEWLVTATGRAVLPSATDPEGRAIRRALGITPETPRWEPAGAVLSVLHERPPIALPQPVPEVLKTPNGSWALYPSGGVQALTDAQSDVLVAAGAGQREVSGGELAAYPDARDQGPLTLPETIPQFIDPGAEEVCATSEGFGAVGSSTSAEMELSGDSVATHLRGLADGAVGVDTGHGFHVVSESGIRHEVTGSDTFQVLGVQRVDAVAWPLLRLLPEGPALTHDAALKATY